MLPFVDLIVILIRLAFSWIHQYPHSLEARHCGWPEQGIEALLKSHMSIYCVARGTQKSKVVRKSSGKQFT